MHQYYPEFDANVSSPSISIGKLKTSTHEVKPSAWLAPKLVTFKGAFKVHFSRIEGCTLTDDQLMDSMEGMVQWMPMPFEMPPVVDRNGFTHSSKPLFLAVEDSFPHPIATSN